MKITSCIYYRVYTIVSVCSFLTLAACSSTTLSTRWNDPSYNDVPIKKIMVIALVNNDINRRALEEGFVKRLQDQGAVGVTSYPLITDPDNPVNEEQLSSIVLQSGVDAVLVSTLLEVKEKDTYVPPRVDWAPTGSYGYYGYYNSSFNNIYHPGYGLTPVTQPGYTKTDVTVRIETKVYSVQTRKPVWAGNTKSFNPSSTSEIITETTKIIIDDMKKSGLLGN